MKRRSTQILLALLLAVTLMAGAVGVLYAKSVTGYVVADSLESGTYVMVVPTITPTGMANGAYCMNLNEAKNPGILFEAFSEENAASAPKWKIMKLSDSTCTIQNPDKGENGYLNLNPAGTLTYGKKQTIQYQHDGVNCVFFVLQGSTRYFIRFTNGGATNEPRFTCGSGEASHQFRLYTEQTYDVEENTAADEPLPDVPPMMTIACISDLHTDYGLQNTKDRIRHSVIATCQALANTEDADILLVGGDMTSDNGKLAQSGGWNYDTFTKVVEKYDQVTSMATTTGYTLWCAGNHEYQAGAYDHYDSYYIYEDMMRDACGEPKSVYYQKNDSTLSDQRYPNHVLGMHYVLNGFDFILINAPYEQSQKYSSGTYTWLTKTLASIGKEKTVFLFTHYPLYNSRGISTPSYGVSGGEYNTLYGILNKYPNLIHLFGHNHGGAESVYISNDTFERITSFSKAGKPVNDRNVAPTSFISAFMGSMSFYNYSLNPDWLGADDPAIVQALMIYVYSDRLVFQMKNYGSAWKAQLPKSWTVMRTVINEENGGTVTTDTSDPQTTDTPSGGTDLPSTSSISEITRSILISAQRRDDIRYDSRQSLPNLTIPEDAVTLKSYSSTLTGPALTADMKLSTKTLSSGDAFTALDEKLKDVVNEHYVTEFSVKNATEAALSAGPLKLTVPVPEGFAEIASDLAFAAYYLDGDGNLCMTDAVLSENGKTLSFALPELTVFSLSAKANVTDLANPNDDENGEDGDGLSALAIVLIIVGAVVAAGGAVFAVWYFVLRKPAPKAVKADAAKDAGANADGTKTDGAKAETDVPTQSE